MQVVDFSRSFMFWRVDMASDKKPQSVTHEPPFSVNTARVAIDCCCNITDLRDGRDTVYVLGASCKTERVGVDRDVWTEPNADFMPLYGESKLMSIKTFACLQTQVDLYPEGRGPQPIDHVVNVDHAFDQFDVDIRYAEGRPLGELGHVIDHTLEGSPLVAQTIIENERYRANIQYPIKTMNVSERDRFFQTDTGPLILPDLSCDPEDMFAGIQVAFAAATDKSWVEFLVREPVDIGSGLQVFHYARTVRHAGIQNAVFALCSGR